MPPKENLFYSNAFEKILIHNEVFGAHEAG
jgi:hypothetical protein